MRTTAKLSQITTRAASLHTFYVIHLLADRRSRDDAFRSYAYFRWVDDWLDTEARSRAESLAFVVRQLDILECCHAGHPPADINGEEAILVDLIRNNPDRSSPLALYTRNMMDVMAFDAGRRGRIISQAELQGYQHSLAVAVTEAMHFFVGRDQFSPRGPERYLAVTAAHITHMLRDTCEDLRAGYFNIPSEFLNTHGISPMATGSPAYRKWIQMRVQQARRGFDAGRRYLGQVQNLRCRLAAHAYMARFESLLDTIERDGFALRTSYGTGATAGSSLRLAGSILASSLGIGGLAQADRPAAPDGFGGGA